MAHLRYPHAKTAHYLGRGMRMIVAGLAPEVIIAVGELTRSWSRFGPIIEPLPGLIPFLQ